VVVAEAGELMQVAHPKAVIGAAQSAAEALKGVIARKPKAVLINGEQYLEFEDWQTVGRFYGYTAGLECEPEYVDVGGVKGFKATSIALDKDGTVRSRATAYCMADEDRWSKAPIYQLASMAQTRANAKVLRNVLSWIAVLAGYKPTPAEEMDGVRSNLGPVASASTDKPRCPKCKSTAKVIVGKYPDKRTGVEKPWYCLADKTVWGDSESGRLPDDEPWDGEPMDEPGSRG
jgi:hypothetical protein